MSRPFLQIAVAWMLISLPASLPAQVAKDKPTFYRNGGWTGLVIATSFGKLDTESAWAIGRHSQETAKDACSGREGRRAQAKCERELIAEPATRIFADCTKGVAWQAAAAWRYQLTERAMAGEFRPADDDGAWTIEMSGRAKFTASSWLAILCPASAARWRLNELAK